MSRKRKPTGLLGPDGRPIAESRYRKPEPTVTMGVDLAAGKDVTLTVTTAKGGDLSGSLYGLTFDRYLGTGFSSVYRSLMGPLAVGESNRGNHVHKRTLADHVTDDLRSLGIDPAAEPEAELPHPPADLTAYADAYTAAVRLCPHEDVESTMYAKGEYQCVACGRYLTPEDMRKRRDNSSFFGRYFGA